MKKDTCSLLSTKKIRSYSSDLVIHKKIPNNPYILSTSSIF